MPTGQQHPDARRVSHRELEKQRESTASDMLQKRQEAEAAVSPPAPAPSPGDPRPSGLFPNCGPQAGVLVVNFLQTLGGVTLLLSLHVILYLCIYLVLRSRETLHAVPHSDTRADARASSSGLPSPTAGRDPPSPPGYSGCLLGSVVAAGAGTPPRSPGWDTSSLTATALCGT